MEAYFAWVREQEPATILSEKTRDGLKYSLNQEEYLKVFLEDGRILIDNSATERAIRPFTVGRANWHIIDTVHGAKVSAMVYSLVETAPGRRTCRRSAANKHNTTNGAPAKTGAPSILGQGTNGWAFTFDHLGAGK